MDTSIYAAGQQMKPGLYYLAIFSVLALLTKFVSSGYIPSRERGLDEVALASLIDRYMEDQAANNGFSGTVLVAKAMTPIYGRSFGYADRNTNRPNTLDTPYNLGSMSKMFTAVAVMQLLEQGKLKLTDTIGMHLRDYPNDRVSRLVTIRHLLTHRSGIGDYFDSPRYQRNKNYLREQQDFLDTFADFRLLFDPNRRYRYSNGGPVILGRIVETVTGMSYYDYLRKNIYQAANMANSDHFTKIETASNKAIGYMDDSGTTNEAALSHIGSAAWGGYASANDLLNYTNALKMNTLIQAETIQQLLEPVLNRGPGCQYAYLHTICTINGYRYYGESTYLKPIETQGGSAKYFWFKDRDIVIIILSNSVPREGSAITVNKIVQWVAYSKV